MLDKKKIIQLTYGAREDYQCNVFYLKRQADVKLVKDKIKEIQDKYWIDYRAYDWYNGIKQYIIRTLHWQCLNDFWKSFSLEKSWNEEEKQQKLLRAWFNPDYITNK